MCQGIALVADDHELARVALASMLAKHLGFARVIETSCLDDALADLERSHVDLALFDLDMPGMQTASSLLAVRECYPAVRVAVVSGSLDRRDVLLALEAGVHGYVPKTMGITAMTDALRHIVEGRIYVPEFLASVGPACVDRPRPASNPPGDCSTPDLSPRQRDVLEHVVLGLSNKEICRKLNLGEGTVKVHLAALFRALGVQNRSAAAAIGARLASSERARDP